MIIRPDGAIAAKKVLSTPADYAVAVIDGVTELIRELGLAQEGLTELLHGTTVATNAILERRGARTALITTKGMRDVLELRRIRTRRVCTIRCMSSPRRFVPRELRFEVDERVGSKGDTVRALNVDDVMGDQAYTQGWHRGRGGDIPALVPARQT